jgi:hypothetical protein
VRQTTRMRSLILGAVDQRILLLHFLCSYHTVMLFVLQMALRITSGSFHSRGQSTVFFNPGWRRAT